MARELWAKIDVGMLHHPKLVVRPDSDRFLWVCLILHAKEHAPESGEVLGITPTDMRSLFHLRCPVKQVEAAMAYFVSCGLLVPVDNGWVVRDFVERQAAYSHEALREHWAEVKRKQRDKSKDKSKDKQRTAPGQLLGNAGLEEEEEEEKNKSMCGAVEHGIGCEPPEKAPHTLVPRLVAGGQP